MSLWFVAQCRKCGVEKENSERRRACTVSESVVICRIVAAEGVLAESMPFSRLETNRHDTTGRLFPISVLAFQLWD